MKKIIILLFVFASAQLGFSQKQTIELNLKTGDTFTQNYNADIAIVQSFNGQEMSIKMNIGSKWSMKVLGYTNNVYDLEATYNHIKMTMALPNGNMEYDSDKNDENDIMSKVLGGMINKPFSFKMTKSGKITEVTGVENLYSGVFDSVGQVDELQKKQILDQIMQSFGDKAFKGNLEMSMAIFPETNVRKGDSWTINTKLESQMTADIQTVYTLTEVGADYYMLSGKSGIKQIESENTVNLNGMDLQYTIAGTMTSNLKIDKATGWIKDGDIRQELDIELKIADNPQVPGGMTIPMQVDSKTKITN
jgi:hypothetical protein